MKIIILSPTNEGTIAKCSSALYEALMGENNVDVKFFSLYKYACGEPILNDCDYLVDRTVDSSADCNIWKKIKWVRDLKKSFNADIVVSTLTSTSMLNVLSGWNSHKIGIFHAPKAQSKAFGKLYYFKTLLTYYFIFPFLNKCYCVSHETKTDLEKVPTIKRNRIDVVYNIHNLGVIEDLSKEELNIEHSVIFSKPVVLYCGRLDDNKAPIRAINAIEKIKDTNLQLVLIGPDPYNMWETLREMIPVKSRHKIHYLGPQQNPYKFMARSTMLISCSYSEGLPGVIIEALSLKVPVVATNSSQGVWEIMGGHQKYDENMSTMEIFDDGIITSNLSLKDKVKYEFDVQNLISAIEYLLAHKLPLSFNFGKDVHKASIVNKFIKP